MTPKRLKAFTIIELVIVVAIIAVLASIVVIGLKYTAGQGKARSTRTTLANLRALSDEARLADKSLFSAVDDTGSIIVSSQRKVFGRPAPGRLDRDTLAPDNVLRYKHYSIWMTQQAVFILRRIPANQKAMDQFPGEMLYEPVERKYKAPIEAIVPPIPPLNITWPADGTSPGRVTPTLALDAWGNPMLYVPADGLSGVWVGSRSNVVVRSTGVYDSTGSASGNAYYDAPGPQDRPFWVSAGPDGDFSKGDDNLYSFEN